MERKLSSLSKFIFNHFNTGVVMELQNDAVHDVLTFPGHLKDLKSERFLQINRWKWSQFAYYWQLVYQRVTPVQAFPCECRKTSRNTFFVENHLRLLLEMYNFTKHKSLILVDIYFRLEIKARSRWHLSLMAKTQLISSSMSNKLTHPAHWKYENILR